MRVAVMGPLEVRTDDSAPVPVAGARERLLLAVLAARAPQPVRVEDLAEILRDGAPPGDDLPEAAPEAVRAVVRSLRAALEPGLPANTSGRYVVRRGPGYALVLPGGEIDAGRFVVLTDRAHTRLAAGDAAEAERLLSAALRLWRGEPYADWPDAAFAQEERRRLTAVRARAEAALAEARRRPAEQRDRPVRAAVSAAPSVPEPRSPDRPDVEEVTDAPPAVPATRRPRRGLLLGAAGVVAALVAAGMVLSSQLDSGRAPAAAAETASVMADADRLARLSTSEGPVDVALLLAVQAVRLSDTPRTRDALAAVLAEHPWVVRVADADGVPQGAMLAGSQPTLVFAADDDIVSWPVGPGTQPRALLPIPEEWGFWAAAFPSPTDDAFVAVGQNEGVPWIRMVSARDGSSRLLMVGEPPGGGRAVTGGMTSDGRHVRLLVVDPDVGGTSSSVRWRILELDVADGATRDTGIRGTFPAATSTFGADVAQDASTLLLWNAAGDAVTLVDLDDGRQVPIRPESRPAEGRDFRALPAGAAQLWADGAVSIVDPSGATIQVLEEHQWPVRDVAVAPDGRWGITAGEGPVVLRWAVDPATGRWSDPEPLAGHTGDVVDVEIDATGRYLVTAARDRTAISWTTDPSAVDERRSTDPVAEACAIVARDLSAVEWERYLPDRPFGPTCSDLS